MSFHEKRSLTLIVSSLIISPAYFLCLYFRFWNPGMELPLLLKFWSTAFLVYVSVMIVSKILIYILFYIICHIASKEKVPCFEDERDQFIELRVSRTFSSLFCLGVLLAMAAPLAGLPPSAIFIIILSSSVLSDIAGECTRLFLYRGGC